MKIRFTKTQRDEMLLALSSRTPSRELVESLRPKLEDVRVLAQSFTLEEVEWLMKAATALLGSPIIASSKWLNTMANLLQRLKGYQLKLETAEVKGKRFVWNGYAVEVLEAIRDGGRPDRKGYKVRCAAGVVHNVWDVQL